MDNGEKMSITGDPSTNNISTGKTKTLSGGGSRDENTIIAGTGDENQKTDKESSQGKTEEAKPAKESHEIKKIEEKNPVEEKKKKKNSAKPNVYSRIKSLEDKLKVLVEAAEQNKRVPKTSNDEMTTEAVRHPVEQRNRHHIQTVARGGGNAHSNAGTYHNRRNYQQKQTQNWNRKELYYQPYDDTYWRQRNKSYVFRGNFNQGGRGTRYRRNDYRQFYNNAENYGNNYYRYQNRFN
ncbi:hypothetical protein KQX54_005910 [Cotesia glomerata]|uniref:Uncharacterized protein n=1 Tax=Cotesia glomerata TaxID=32391 RepID=A0AAV7ITK3_COTGL|nr:hypothetical protein KQX54_005910 [Cotesia glomerata]